MDSVKVPEPKEIPEKFRDDARLREAYLTGYRDCATVYLKGTGQLRGPGDDSVQVYNFGDVHDLIQRVGALESRVQVLEGDARDRALSVESIKRDQKTMQGDIHAIEEWQSKREGV